MSPLFYSVVGWIGTAFILTAYFFCAIGRLRAGSRLHSVMNMAGAIGIGLNVYNSHAWPALMLQIAWGLIALVSIFYPALRPPQRAKQDLPPNNNATPSEYHREYAALPDTEIAKRVSVKKEELRSLFAEMKPETDGRTAEVAVIGCGDRRFVAPHRAMFAELLGKPVNQTTFDITTEHLAGEEGVMTHDCTAPLPGGPYDLTFGHVVLRFIPTELQWNLIKNSYDALKPGGMAIHVMDADDYTTESEMLPNGKYAVPLQRWREEMDRAGMRHVEVPVKFGLALGIKR